MPSTSNHAAAPETAAYGRVFWWSYLANTSLMVAVSLLFRYADFVKLLGGSESQLGLIVGLGMVGALAMRVFQGVAIDHYGPGRIWRWSLVGFIASVLLHLVVESAQSPLVYIARTLLATSIAGAFGASITYVSLLAPQQRVSEMIGTLGTSGFIGMMIGPTLGDSLFASGEATRAEVDRMFLFAAAIGAISLVFTWLATPRRARRIERTRRPRLLGLLRKYHPGMVLLVAVAMGVGIGLPHTFLRSYTDELGINHIKTFFLVYAATGFAVRLATRTMAQRCGTRPMILIGLSCLAGSMLLYLLVRTEASLAIPAVVGGIAHAFLFPAVIGGGMVVFPRRYRGTATTAMMAMFDIGYLFGQPAIGGVLDFSRDMGWPAYPTMFVSLAVLFVVVATVFALAPAKPSHRASRVVFAPAKTTSRR